MKIADGCSRNRRNIQRRAASTHTHARTCEHSHMPMSVTNVLLWKEEKRRKKKRLAFLLLFFLFIFILVAEFEETRTQFACCCLFIFFVFLLLSVRFCTHTHALSARLLPLFLLFLLVKFYFLVGSLNCGRATRLFWNDTTQALVCVLNMSRHRHEIEPSTRWAPVSWPKSRHQCVARAIRSKSRRAENVSGFLIDSGWETFESTRRPVNRNLECQLRAQTSIRKNDKPLLAQYVQTTRTRFSSSLSSFT